MNILALLESLARKFSLVDSKGLHQTQEMRLVQAEDSRGGGSIAPGSRQSPSDDICAGGVYGCAIGQTLRGSFRF